MQRVKLQTYLEYNTLFYIFFSPPLLENHGNAMKDFLVNLEQHTLTHSTFKGS